MAESPLNIRLLKPDEVEVFREVRLRALAESPDAFGETWHQAQAQPDTYWERLTESVTQPQGQVMVLAEHADRVIGSAFGLRDRHAPDIGHVGGMWVEPAFRASGVGTALMTRLLTWAEQQEYEILELWVTEGNEGAIAFYRKFGFVETGKRDILPSNPTLNVIQMSLNRRPQN